jgi:uncharacterized membrane protein YqgA involved in biofilm formation
MISVPLAKTAVHLISGLGVSKVVYSVIRNNATVVTTLDRVQVTIGSLVIGSMVGQQASKHVDERINAAVAWYENRNTDQTDLKVEN